ncbi:hypothetical protein RCL_jg22929.t1 [Rhizophagus clarus]|uniref:Uncharacterized protein n=1 Tax=Rhizophagus clarus TaxID=94130 RepID=A0A8H3QHK0_9GLOM|nr:hypothetical protein RCL_jg22929.t1 [Rhizophagus clarus]
MENHYTSVVNYLIRLVNVAQLLINEAYGRILTLNHYSSINTNVSSNFTETIVKQLKLNVQAKLSIKSLDIVYLLTVRI